MDETAAAFIIRKNIARIKQRMQEHPELQKAHHFCYDHRLEFGSVRVDYVVMGINPGETEEDYKRHQAPPPGEETSEVDFHLPDPSPSKKRWLKDAEFYCGSRNIAFTNCFFWSSSKESQVQERYNAALDEHFRFCAGLNVELINIHKPKAVIFTGISHETRERVSRLYNLRGPMSIEGNERLVAIYNDGVRPWIITKHWHARIPIAKADKAIIQQVISDVVREWWQ